jgi:FlaA1/EpsC-like NDP-sugar epimerase
MGSRGSVIPFFIQEKKNGVLPITDNRMTRFMITLEEGVELVWKAFDDMCGGEIYVKKIPSMKVTDLAIAIDKGAIQKVIGIRPGEKLHEEMIGEDDSIYTYEYDDYYKILPAINNWSSSKKLIKNGKQVENGFSYTSDNNEEWMSIETLQEWIKNNKNKIGKI